MKHNVVIPQYKENGVFIRKNYSFSRRIGRLNKSQLYAIKHYWRLYGINFSLDKQLEFNSLFANSLPIVLDIGFGTGNALIYKAINFSKKNFVGIEVYKSGIGSCLRLAYVHDLKNIKIIYHDAVEVLQYMILDNTVSIIQLFFPDPWHKKRHNKRRILNYYFLNLILKKLILKGKLHIVTDSKEYFIYILNVIKTIKNYKKIKKNDSFFCTTSNIPTKFEKKAYLKGHIVYDVIFQKSCVI